MKRVSAPILLSLIMLPQFFLFMACRRQTGDLSNQELKKIFSSGIYFLTARYEIKDTEALDRAIDLLYGLEGNTSITAAHIKRISDFDEESSSYFAEMDIQSESRAGLVLPTWKLTLEKGTDQDGNGIYSLFLLKNNPERQLILYESVIPEYLKRADGISDHFHKQKSMVN